MITTKHANGNALVTIDSDGTRVIDFNGELQLDSPLNVDIRIMTKCSFGMNSKGTAICDFCHESATVDGDECNYDDLYEKLKPLPTGTELAIGMNDLSPGLIQFLEKCRDRFICSCTINSGHVKKHKSKLLELLDDGLIAGLGISYREGMTIVNIDHPNVVWHVIAGIDNIVDVKTLASHGISKILVLGEKDFGFNLGKVDLNTQCHKEWFWFIHELFDIYDVVSFDNLALEQLKIKRFFTKELFDVFNQKEHSLYINSVDGYFSPSSRNPLKVDWNTMNVNEFYKHKLNSVESINVVVV